MASKSSDPYSKSTKRPRIFVSHSSADNEQASDLYKKLLAEGTPWMDLFDLRPGEPWENKTREAISAADVFVVCISRNSNSRTGFLEKETAMILAEAKEESGKLLIPVRFDDSPVPTIVSKYIYVDLFAEDGYEKLRLALAAIRESPPAKTAQVSNLDVSPSDKPDRPPIAPAATEAEESFPEDGLLRLGSKGKLVTAVQLRLRTLGYDVFADGTYGPSTQAAVRGYQITNNLRSTDGLVGPNTWRALFGQEPVERKSSPRKPESASQKAATDAHPAGSAAASATTATTPEIVKEGLDEDARERKALNDKPVDDVSKDTLGFRDYVFALRDFIASQSTTTPLTISINGLWGSGKSSLMRMLQNELEPSPRRGLWWIKARWLAGYLYGSVFWAVGRLLVRLKSPNAEYVKLAFAFQPDEDVTDANFDRLFESCIEFSLIQDFGKPSGDSEAQQRIDHERERRVTKTRFWARQAVRRRKMTPPSHPTVWFNAWKFNQQEQLWAALATAVLGQLTKKYGFFTRLYLLGKLTWKRTDKIRTINQISRKLILPVAIAGLVALYQLKRETLLAFFPSLQQNPWLTKDTWLWLAPVLAAMWQAIKAIEDPFKIPIDELVTSPDYQGKIGFIGTFEEDFGRIVEVAIRRSIFWQPRKLIIFIDDLDRCGPTQAAGIVEAINLFLDSIGCVFVLGMDMNAVAISIEVKYKELTERMRKDAPDDVSPGVLFLDKIVQIPFNVPRPNKAYIRALVDKMTEAPSRELPAIRPVLPDSKVSQNGNPLVAAAAAPTNAPGKATATPAVSSLLKTDRAGFAQQDIRDAIATATTLLKENPRQVKRFINLFRLQVYIAHERGLLSEDINRLSPRILAVWVAWSMQWPEILRLLSNPAQTESLRKSLAMIAEGIAPLSDAPVEWKLPSQQAYFKFLTDARTDAKDSNALSHWSNLPWTFWTGDNDFLRCVKQLELYWRRPELLESMLDMTQVTVSEKATAADAPPPVAATASPASVTA